MKCDTTFASPKARSPIIKPMMNRFMAYKVELAIQPGGFHKNALSPPKSKPAIEICVVEAFQLASAANLI